MQNTYFPEGALFATEDNREYTSSLAFLERAKDRGIILEGKVTLCDLDHNLHVDFGKFHGIIPKDEALFSPTGEPIKDIAIITRVGKNVCFVVKEIKNGERGTLLILSRRLAQKECFENYISTLRAGDVINACVTHTERFGAFCDIGCGLVALLPIDCISISRIKHPNERFFCGQTIKCAVKSIDSDTWRVTLTHKELLGTWEENARLFEAGQTVEGIVRSVETYGIFVELTPNIAGLAEWCDTVDVGMKVSVYIKSIIPEKMKIKLAIVNVLGESVQKQMPEYFFCGNHMNSWFYSPSICDREISTVFE